MTHVNAPGDRGKYLDYLARCRQAFTPFAPIELPDFFAGRKDVIEDVLSELEAPGRQVAIYGERGVGKTSLAKLLYFFAKYDDEHVHVYRCRKESTFEEICLDLAIHTRRHLVLDEVRTESSRGLKGTVGPVGVRRSGTKSATYRSLDSQRNLTSARMLDIFAESKTLLIIDEYDRVRDNDTHVRMAEMIKHFSDARSSAKIVVVGVADTLSHLIGEHESLSRSLAQIKLARMTNDELSDIIQRGAERIGATIAPAVQRKIVALADGFPQFVHLICLYASMAAGKRLLVEAPLTPTVDEGAYRTGLDSAIAKAEHTLQEGYEAAVVTTRKKSDIYEMVLSAIAMADERDVQVQDLARHASRLAQETLRPEKFSNVLGQLVKEDRGQILTKVRDGYYKFTNPLMRAYVRCMLEFENVSQHDGQFEFPFMRT